MLPEELSCYNCLHFHQTKKLWSCDAFPKGIPKKIIYVGPPEGPCKGEYVYTHASDSLDE